MVKYIAKRKIELWQEEEYLYIGKNKQLVDDIDKALSMGSEFLCDIIIDTFIEGTEYKKEDFEIIKLKKEIENE